MKFSKTRKIKFCKIKNQIKSIQIDDKGLLKKKKNSLIDKFNPQGKQMAKLVNQIPQIN